MSSSQSTKNPQQPRGLPGFLRRTFRNSSEQLDAPSTAPGTPVLPTTEDPYIRGSSNEGDSSQDSGSDDGMNNNTPAKSGRGTDDANGGASDVNETPVGLARAWSGTTPGSSKKHLRAVAFPPLPQENGKDDSSDGIRTSAAKSSSLPNNPPSTDSKSETPNSTATTSTASPVKKSYKEIQFETMLASPIIPLRDLRKLAWNGIPPHHRPIIWKILLGYLPANTSRHVTTLIRRRREYKDAIKQHYDIPDDSRTNSEQETLRQVLVDVPRTAPEVPLFHNDRVRRCLSRLLYIWAMRHPASSYVQGINDLATPLISVFLSGYFDGKDCLDGEIMADVTDIMLEEVEADTYWCLTSLLAGIQDHYTSDQPGMQRMVMHLEELTNRIDADLAAHLRNTGIEFLQFAFKWMNCLLLREFRLPCVMRLWDTYFSEGDGGFENFHVYVCASFLVHFSADLQQMGFDDLFQFMQNMPTHDWGDREIEILLSSAFVLSTLFAGSDAHLNVVRHSV